MTLVCTTWRCDTCGKEKTFKTLRPEGWQLPTGGWPLSDSVLGKVNGSFCTIACLLGRVEEVFAQAVEAAA